MTSLKNLDFRAVMQNQQIAPQKEEKNAKIIEYDFKIVSFKIGEEFYGIDIMNVKEILKDSKFTRVPNALDFVVGVYNLRGEIMPIIDLAKMFNLPHNEENGKVIKSIIVVTVENLKIGVIVDRIQHVIPLRKDSIQPPSPLLGSINERYIEGVAEIDNKLYVILDIESIFSDKEKAKKETLSQSSDLSEEFFSFYCNQLEELLGIHLYDVNSSKIKEVYAEFERENNLTEMPKLSREHAQSALRRIQSRHNGQLWDQPYARYFVDSVQPILTKFCSEEVRVLDIGCGDGLEAYSLYMLFAENFPDADVKVIAADSDLMAVGNASGLVVESYDVPQWISKGKYFTESAPGKLKVKRDIVDSMYFEFHDAKNIYTYKKIFDIIVVRDLSFYMKESDYKEFISNVVQRLAAGGVLVIGDNEVINDPHYKAVESEHISLYIKK